MYNKYMPRDMEAFSDLYRPIEYDEEKPREKSEETLRHVGNERHERFDLKRLLRGLDVEKMGILPLVLLLLLLLDVDDEEKIIIIALAVIFGI